MMVDSKISDGMLKYVQRSYYALVQYSRMPCAYEIQVFHALLMLVQVPRTCTVHVPRYVFLLRRNILWIHISYVWFCRYWLICLWSIWVMNWPWAVWLACCQFCASVRANLNQSLASWHRPYGVSSHSCTSFCTCAKTAVYCGTYSQPISCVIGLQWWQPFILLWVVHVVHTCTGTYPNLNKLFRSVHVDCAWECVEILHGLLVLVQAGEDLQDDYRFCVQFLLNNLCKSDDGVRNLQPYSDLVRQHYVRFVCL